jgi:group I intron endonuclease
MQNSFSNCGIYRWLNTVTGQAYIGSSKHLHRRRNEHLRELRKGVSPCFKLQHAWNKYGETAFEFEALAFCLEDDLLRQEQLALNAFDAVNTGYNISPEAGAPMRGRKVSPETRLKISLANKGRPKTPEHVRKIREGLTGLKRSQATRDKFSVLRRGKPATASQLNALKIGRSKLGLPEIRAKIGNISRLIWQRPERRNKAEVRTKLLFEQALAAYLQNPAHCAVCGNIISPLPHQNTMLWVNRLRSRKHCNRACANRARIGEKHVMTPEWRQAISGGKRAAKAKRVGA